MNTRSLKFQLSVWYASLLTAGLALLGIITYVALERSLTGALKENQFRRARQVSQLLSELLDKRNANAAGPEIEARYAPGLNDRFVRVSRRDGAVIYLSPRHESQTFSPAAIGPPAWADKAESARVVPLEGGRKMMLAGHVLQTANGESYLVESGAPMDTVQSDLRHWLFFLGIMLPTIAALGLAGGYLLVKRALLPVDKIAATAERISSHTLSERLPVPQNGDEIERLTTALNHMIDRLDAAFQHSRRFVADASHELRTPLTTLRGELETLLRDPRSPREWREQLGSPLEEVERLAQIVEGLFAISRLDAGEAAAEWVPFDLAQLAISTADQMALLAEDKQIHVTCTGSIGVWVQGDRARMRQVVVNLLDNAIKYTPPGGSVTLTVRAQDAKAVLEVADTGMGIPSHALPKVFERFFRVDKARSRDEGGAGLGLAIVKSICTAHEGRVEANSKPGYGSQFRVELPLVPAAPKSQTLVSKNEH